MTNPQIEDIKIGHRHRRDMGDIDELARNISEVGLLHPVVLAPGNKLIAGARRIAAFKKLGRTKIPATVIDLEKVVLGEYAENTFRKAFTPTEAIDIADAIEPVERAKARERQAHGRTAPGKSLAGNSHNRSPTALDKVAKAVGRDRKTIEKARAVRDAAKERPELFGKLAEDMDRTGRVDGPFKRLKVMRQAEVIRAEPPPLPDRGPYRVIVADPPWPYELRKKDPSHRATHPYPQMSIAQICEVDAGRIAHDDCALWLWTTNHHLREAFNVLDAWNFQHKTILTWAKDRMGTGDWLRGQTEHCLFAIRGKPTIILTNQTTLLRGPLRANSQKPDEFYEMVETLCPSPRYAYLFSRNFRERWDGHGDEVPEAAE
jgi:N6-adenosine-specific RNA methylase IME4